MKLANKVISLLEASSRSNKFRSSLAEGEKGDYKALQKEMKNMFDADSQEEAVGNALFAIGRFMGDKRVEKLGDKVLDMETGTLKSDYKKMKMDMRGLFDTSDQEEAVGNALFAMGKRLGFKKLEKLGDDILRTGKLSESEEDLLSEDIDPENRRVAKLVVDALNKKIKSRHKIADYFAWIEGDVRAEDSDFADDVADLVGDKFDDMDGEEQVMALIKKLKIK